MSIRMVGIDHSKASLDYREAFSFTKAGVKEAIKEIKQRFNVRGCILLSTCNRTELWVSQSENEKFNKVSPYHMLCQVKNIKNGLYEEFFTERNNSEAIEHILKVVCGFDSKIFGEDQIISQVREALQMSRDCNCTDKALEKVFQMSLSAGKRVKTEIRMSTVNRSSANDMLRILNQEVNSIRGKDCLVIGNGQMGRLVANTLISHGANVSMTLRRKIHGCDEQASIMPDKCKMIPYDDRIEAIPNNEIIVSATLSPHYTMRLEDIQSKMKMDKYYLFDLAVPRDIDPRIATMSNVKLFDIDSMNTGSPEEENREQINLALNILNQYREELDRWFKFRNYVPKIQKIVEMVSEDTVQRFSSQTCEHNTLEEAAGIAEESAKKATGKLIYGLREQLEPELWEKCLEALQKAAEKETLKH
ncbi:MAG: glutamyl-tRNA reductase [Aminipila sp.]